MPRTPRIIVPHLRRTWFLVIGCLLAGGCLGCHADPPVLLTPGQRALVDTEVLQLIEETLGRVEQEPRQATLRGRLAMIYHAHGLYEPAEVTYRQALALARGNARWWYYLAHVREALGDVPGAVQAVRECLEREPRYVPARWYYGLWLLNQGFLAEARETFREAATLDARSPAGPLGLARVALQEGAYEEAAALMERLLHTYPDLGYARHLLGTAYRHQGRLAEATQELGQGVGAQPTIADPWLSEVTRLKVGYRAVVEQAQALLGVRRPADAIALLERERRHRPRDFEILYTLGTAYFSANRLDEAAALFEQLCAAFPDAFLPYLSLGAVRELRGDLDQAFSLTNRAIALNPAYADAYRQKARLLIRREAFEEALTALDDALRHDPRNLELLQTRLKVLNVQRRWTALAADSEHLIQDFSFWAPGFLWLAIARAEQGNFEEAQNALTQAAARRVTQPMIEEARARIDSLQHSRKLP